MDLMYNIPMKSWSSRDNVEIVYIEKVQSSIKRDGVSYKFIFYLTRALPSTDELFTNEGPADIGRILNNKYIFFNWQIYNNLLVFPKHISVIHFQVMNEKKII